MSSKNPISFAFSVLFEIAAVVAIVSVLPRVNLRPTVSANQSTWQDFPLQTTDLRTQSSQPWPSISRSQEQASAPALLPVIEATPVSPQYVERQLDRASQRLLNTVGGAVNQASQEWLRPIPSATPTMNSAPAGQVIGAGYAPENAYNSQPPSRYLEQPVPAQTAHKPSSWQTATPRTTEPRHWLRY